MKSKDRPFYRDKYQFELAYEITGKNKRAIQMYMRRHNISIVEYLKTYFKKTDRGV